MEDLGHPISYLVAKRGTVFSSDGQQLGRVARVLAAPEAHMFDGILFDTGWGPSGRRTSSRSRRRTSHCRSGGASPELGLPINMPPMQRLFLIIGACLALVLAGCGDDSSTTAGGSDYTVPQGTKERRAAEKKAAAEEAAAAKKAVADAPEVSVPKGPPPKRLVIENLKTGSGATAEPGDQVTVHYVGVLYDGGEMFDANWGNEPLGFELGAQQVISGWDQGVQGMSVGGERKLIIPPDLAYGSKGAFPSIPPNATLVFQIELLDVE
jgi:FKBP-type peptidyl-prolyl cis-trans isomerase